MYNVGMNADIDILVKRWAKQVGKRSTVTPKYLARTLRNEFKKEGWIVKISFDNFIEIDDYVYQPDVYAIRGAFVPDEPRWQFTMEFLFPAATIENGFKPSEGWLDTFAHEAAQVAMHENQHWMQNARRGDVLVDTRYRLTSDRNEAYLGDYDEVDAYGVAIAYQLNETLGTESALDLLRRPEIVTTNCADFNEYTKTFDAGHEVRKRLLKKIATHLINV